MAIGERHSVCSLYEPDSTLLPSAEIVYSRGMNDRDVKNEITKLRNEMSKKIDALAIAKTGEPLDGTSYDRRLDKIADNLSELRSTIAGLASKVDSNIKLGEKVLAVFFCFFLSIGGYLWHVNSVLTHIQDVMPSVELQSTVSGRLSPTKLKHIEAIVAKAKTSGRTIDPAIVSEVGTQLITEKQASPNLEELAWETAVHLIDYRSTLNAGLAPVPSGNLNARPPLGQYLHYNILSIAAFPPGGRPLLMRVHFYGKASPENAALMDKLDTPPPPGLTSGAQFIVVDGGGGGLSIDGYRMKNVILKNIRVFYSGVPVVLESVYFVNCTFKITRKPNGEIFGKQLLASAAVSFKVAGSDITSWLSPPGLGRSLKILSWSFPNPQMSQQTQGVLPHPSGGL